jgi:predicted nucleotidyltransferase
MKHPAAGIIAEYNPFHNGHKFHIAKTRERLGDACAVVCVLSAHAVQRGEFAIGDAAVRARAALLHGADLVVALPAPWSCASANRFAEGAAVILSGLGLVTHLSFGMESDTLQPLADLSRGLESPVYKNVFQSLRARGLSFPDAQAKAAAEALGPESAALLSGPNNSLALCYLRALRGTGIEPAGVTRAGAAHDAPETGDAVYASASAIRTLWRDGQDFSAYVPHPIESPPVDLLRCERAVLASLRQWAGKTFCPMTLEKTLALPEVGREGLHERFLNAVRDACSLEELYARVKTRRYTHSRIRRLVLSAYLGLTEELAAAGPQYIRVLGFNERGRGLLRECRVNGTALPLIVKPASVRSLPEPAQKLFEAESRVDDLYGLAREKPTPCGGLWRQSPVVVYTGLRPSMALASVSSSACSRWPPMGMP